jgi:branched-chain amino acid transport system substrate-binding protein
LFITAGGRRFNDPKTFPWTIPLYPDFETEGRVIAKYILKAKPDARIGVLYQNDDFGKDFIKGFRERLGDKASAIMVRAVSYELTDATVDSQIIDLASTKANVFLNISTPKFAVQAIRKAYELGWKPLQIIDNPAASVGVVMRPAGIEAAKGIVSAAFVKDPSDPQYKDDPEFLAWVAWMKKYFPTGSLEDVQNAVGYVQAQAMVQVLKQCGDTLTRENVMKQAANLKDFHPAMLLKGINMNTAPDDYQPMEEMLMQRFNGERFEVFGDLLSARMNK